MRHERVGQDSFYHDFTDGPEIAEQVALGHSQREERFNPEPVAEEQAPAPRTGAVGTSGAEGFVMPAYFAHDGLAAGQEEDDQVLRPLRWRNLRSPGHDQRRLVGRRSSGLRWIRPSLTLRPPITGE